MTRRATNAAGRRGRGGFTPLLLVLCDDHRMFMESLEAALVSRGHQILGAVDKPSEAVDLATTESADLCIMDLSFDNSNALEAIKELSLAGIRVVVLSGYLDDLVRARCLEAGADACAGKDWPLEEVFSCIEGTPSKPTRPSSHNGAVAPDPWSTNPLARFLTTREREVLVALVKGETTEKLARQMGISPATVRTHVQTMLTKLGVHSRLEAASFAIRNSLVAPSQVSPTGPGRDGILRPPPVRRGHSSEGR
jgi:two-component system, NarL family, nitrate/nitrite response regulator NarL